MEMDKVRQWAAKRIQSGVEPPWAWYQYMKVIEAIDAIENGMAVTTTENSPQLVERRGEHDQLAGPKRPQDTSRRHPSKVRVRMPM